MGSLNPKISTENSKHLILSRLMNKDQAKKYKLTNKKEDPKKDDSPV